MSEPSQQDLAKVYEDRERKVDPSHYVGNVIFVQNDSTGRYFWYFAHKDIPQEVHQISQVFDLKATLTFEKRMTNVNVFFGKVSQCCKYH